MKSIYSIKATQLPASYKDVDGKKGIVTGYFANFNSEDSDGDVILHGSFAKSIGDTGPNSANPRIKHLMNHRPDQPLGKLLVLREDSTGLYYESQIGTHNLGMDFIKMVESGLVSEHSIGYRRIKWDADANNSNLTYLKELQLWEGSSLTAWGANSLTPLTGLKSEFKLDELMEKQKQIENFCKSTDATDETVQMLLLHSKQLSQIILDIQATKQHESTLQGNHKDLFEALTTFNKQLIK